jgi:putative peptide zinc metalloprotease protein
VLPEKAWRRNHMADEYQIIDESVIKFHDLYKGEEEDGLVLVGRRDIGSYVSLPVEAIEVIDLLDSGKPVGEVKKILEVKYGEEAEIEDFIEDMISNEMVHFVNDYEVPTTSELQKDLFSRITGTHVGWMFSKYAWAFYGTLGAGCLLLFAVYPQYIPQPADFFWHPWYSVAVGFMFFFGWVLVAFHELAHLFAAKTVGTEGYFSLSNRLIFIVAQTNLGNIWTVPREKRYIVYLAGMAWDSVMIFFCLILLLFSDNQVIHLPELAYNFVKAIIFIKVWGVIWQFRFNMQTDVYYVVANYFRCRNLLGDAQARIKNFLSRFISRFEKTDFSDTPQSEMKAIKWYTPLYFVGTVVTLATYLLRNLPLIILQVKRALDGILTGYAANHALFIDAVVLIILTSFNFGMLGFLILRPRWQGIKQWFSGVLSK